MSEKKEVECGGAPDEALKNGPAENRGCTDIICCLAFIVSSLAMLYIAAYGLAEGDPTKLSYAYDPNGYGCGSTTTMASNPYDGGAAVNYEEYKYLYFVAPSATSLSRYTCVKKCPTDYTTPLECVKNSRVSNCNMNVGSNYSDPSVTLVYPSKVLLGKLCQPTGGATAGASGTASLGDAANIEGLQAAVNDIRATLSIIMGSSIFAMVFGIGFMLLMKCFSGVVVWTFVITFLLCEFILAAFFFQKYTQLKDEGLEANKTSEQMNMALAGLLGIIAVISLIAVCCARNTIALVIAILKTGADYVKKTPSVLFVPPIFSLVSLIFWLVFLTLLAYIYSTGDINKASVYPFGKNLYFYSLKASIKTDKQQSQMLWYFIFGGLWTNAFIDALSQFVLASSVAIWYFAGGQGTHNTIRRSVYRAFRFHLGSLAFGAFILAVVQFIRLILAYVAQQAKKGGGDNKVMLKIIACLQCYLACFERFIKFLNKNAYIQIALTGKNFCSAAKDAFWLIVNNPGKFALVATLGGVFIIIGQLFICGTSTVLGYFIINNVSHYSDNMQSAYAPTIFIFFVTFTIGGLIMSVYGMACDTILQCYLVDEKVSKGQPSNCPATMKDFVENNCKE